MIEIPKDVDKDLLERTATKLEVLLERYASSSQDVQAARTRWQPVIDLAKRREILAPGQRSLEATYFSGEYEVVDFRDLFHSAALFDLFLQGWRSEEDYGEFLDQDD